MTTDKQRSNDATPIQSSASIDANAAGALGDPAAQEAGGQKAQRAPFEPSFSWDDPIKLMKSLGWAWRDVTDRETPTFLQLVELGVVRVDVDEPTGYVVVHTEGESHHAIGMRREAIVPLAAVLTGRSADEIKRAISAGPAKLEALKKERKKRRAQDTEQSEG